MTEVSLYPVGKDSGLSLCGELIVYNKLISPLGDIDTSTGYLRDVSSVKNKVLAIRGFTGSTVGPYVIYSLRKRSLVPKAMIVEQLDANVITSAVVSAVPLFRVDDLIHIEKMYEEGLRYVCIEDGKLRPQGVLVAIEGLDGAGKTTISKHLLEVFRKCGFRALYTYEPYYEAIRSIFEEETVKLTPEAEALLMVADRYSHYSWVVKKEVESGSIVILDRYKYSTIAYQGAAGLPVDWLREMQRYLPDPDVGVYLDIDPEEGIKRKVKSELRTLKYFEKLERLKKAREIYSDVVLRGELVLVDASPGVLDVVKKVVEVIEEKIGLDLRRCFS